MKKIILASQSPYRKALLNRVGLIFETCSPKVDEEELKIKLLTQQTSPSQVSEALASFKAQSVAHECPDAFIIGSDQLLEFRGQIFGKSYGQEKAVEQLMRLQGQDHFLLTSVALVRDSKLLDVWTVKAKLKMRKLSESEIIEYVKRDNPIDCAGSYKLEKAGILLFDQIECSDWTAIEGLPIMSLTQKLRLQGAF